MTSPSRLPRPLVAGIGFVSSLPGLVAQIPARLPGIALTSALEARTRYLEFLRAGEEFLAGRAAGEQAADAGEPATARRTRRDEDTRARFDDEVDHEHDAPLPSELPIENYDDLGAAAIRPHLSRLDAIDIQALLDYEFAHAARKTVITMLESRLARLDAD